MVLLHKQVKKITPPQSKITLSYNVMIPIEKIKNNFLKTNYPTHLISNLQITNKYFLITPNTK